MRYFILDSLQMNGEQISDNEYRIHLANGKQIVILESPVYNDVPWAWKVDTQYFSNDRHALNYLKQLIAEKLTDVRVLFHEKKNVPEICGVNGRACRSPGKCNTALCSYCPIAEAFFAERDGVKVVYAV